MSLKTMRRAQKIKEIVPIVNGIFSHMNYVFRTEVTKANLDVLFVTEYGKRNPSPVVEYVQGDTNYGKQLTDAQLTTLAGIILEMYKERWDKLGAIYSINYDPIHNYLDEWEDESEEVLDGESTKLESDTTTYGKTISNSLSRSDSTHIVNDTDETSGSTRTDNLLETETRNTQDSKTQTDNLLQTEGFGKTSTVTNNLTEEISYASTDTTTNNLTQELTHGMQQQRTDNLTETVDQDKTTTQADGSTQSVFPFNSSVNFPTDTDSGTHTGTDTNDVTTHNTGTQTTVDSGKDTTTNIGTQADAHTGKDTTSNTGTQATALSGTNTVANTGTRTVVDNGTGTVSVANTGTTGTSSSHTLDSTVDSTATRNVISSEGTTGSDRLAKSGSSTEDATTTRDRSGRHFGNIGNLTSQKQILEEINLWKWNYMREILNDVKEFCTLPVYLNATEWTLT